MKPPSKRPAREPAKLRLTENQAKVIKDKYLRDSPGVEAWLAGVSRNIALAEILLHPKAESWGVFQGVRLESRDVAGPRGLPPSASRLFHAGLASLDEREANFARLLGNLESVCRARPEAGRLVEAWTRKFYALLCSWDFLPNSPTLMNAGRELQQLSACYVLPVPDSMEGITAALSAQCLIQKSGGGTGMSFSALRPKGDLVRKTRGVASGALSFMEIFDTMTKVVRQGGARRGANMGILSYTHPEILDFILLKSRPKAMENFNLSVAIDERFMRLVEADAEYDLLNPRTGKPAGKARAREVFDRMCEQAWKTGDPGYVVLDRINASGSNPTPALGAIESTNPCGELPLLAWEPCNLGSINLSNFVAGPLTKGRFDFPRLAQAAALAARFLDDVVEINNYPLPEIERMAKGNRRIGLGVMGWAEALVKLGIPYDAPEALELAERLMRFVSDKALEASEALARERGAFPNWKGSVYDPQSPHYRGEERFPRHCARTTIAPTGTIAIAAGLQGGGIEPFFAVAYTRYNAKAIDALKEGRQPEAADTFIEVNPLFQELSAANSFWGLSKQELWRKISDNKHSVRGLAEVPPEVQRLFPAAHDITPEVHVRLQAAFQRHTDNGVSKTINLPATATVEDVRRAYLLAYELGSKGVTVYRDGSKAQQVLSLSPAPSLAKRRDPAAAFGACSEYYQINTGYGPLHIHINYDERGPYQIFANIPPLGTEISALTSLVGILLSKYLAEGGDPARILKHLNSVKGDRPIGLGDSRIDSIAHAVAIALREHLRKTGWLPETKGAAAKPLAGTSASGSLSGPEYCPKCHSSNIAYESGCPGPTCHECGFSSCS